MSDSQPRHVPDDLFPGLAAGPRPAPRRLIRAERAALRHWKAIMPEVVRARDACMAGDRRAGREWVRLGNEAHRRAEALKTIQRAIRNYGHRTIAPLEAFEHWKACSPTIHRANAEAVAAHQALEEAKKEENA